MHRSLLRLLPKASLKPSYFSALTPCLSVSFVVTKPKSDQYAVMKEVGLKNHLNKMYNITMWSLSGALGISYMMAATKFALLSQFACFGVGAIGSLGSVIAFSRFTRSQSTMVTDSKGQECLTSENSPARLALYSTFVGCSGLIMAPLVGHYLIMNPLIALGLFHTVMYVSFYYVFTRPKDSLLWLGGPLKGVLVSMIGIQLLSLGVSWTYGPNMFSIMAYRADVYLGTGLFTAFVAYDTQVAIKDYENGNADHLGASMRMFLNFQNLGASLCVFLYFQNIFVRMLRIVGNFYGDN